MVLKKSLILFACGLFLLFTQRTQAQVNQTSKGQFHTFANGTDNFTFNYKGTLVKRGDNEFLIELPEAANKGNGGGRVHVFVSRQPFVYLPGTYGGRYYFDADKQPGVFSDYVHEDSVTVSGLKFARDYWAVYAGQGQWETVDNCYAFHDGQYFTISLTRDFQTGMPGAKINGVFRSKQEMRASIMERMRDTNNVSVKGFNQILRTFSISK